MIEGKTVYGPRKELSVEKEDKLFYFICIYGEDCSKTQNYTKAGFKEQLEKRNLTPFDLKKMKSRRDLMIWEWKKHVPLSGTFCYLYL